MATNTAPAPTKIPLDQVIEAIKQMSMAERNLLVTTLKRIGLYEIQSIPYVVKLEQGKTLEQTLRERGFTGTNWARVDEIVKQFNLSEPTEGFEEQLYLTD